MSAYLFHLFVQTNLTCKELVTYTYNIKLGVTTLFCVTSDKLTMQQEVAKSFLKSFQLSAAELSALREANLTEDFFTALNRVQTIHSNCRTLMQSGHQTCALDIMDQMAMYQVICLFDFYDGV